MAESPVSTPPPMTTPPPRRSSTPTSWARRRASSSMTGAGIGGDKQRRAGRHTSDLLRRAELSKLSENPEMDRRAREAMLIILTLLLALVMPILLWLSAGETPLLVWRLSLLLTTYFFLCANMLFVTKCFCAVVVDFYFGALLAYFADHVFGPRIGTVTIYLSSIFAAGFAGYALAERRRSDGTERSADNVPSFAGEEEEEYARAVLISSVGVISMTLLVPTAYVAWMILWPHTNIEDGYRVEDILRDLSYTILAYLFFSTTLVTRHLLRGALLGEGGNFHIFLIAFAVITVLPFIFAAIFGDLAGIVVIWLGILVLTVLFGYCVGVYSCYNQIQKMRSSSSSSQPPSEKVDAAKQELAEISRDKLEHTSSPPPVSSSASSSAEGSQQGIAGGSGS
uniref:Uncharacterized protein n=1 Tax=Oryza punctata TaxID=4537 RepID=A0A0E0JYK1_ORYPU